MMKWFDWVEYAGLNVVAVSVVGWLSSFINTWSTLIAIFVGASVVALNYAKFKGVQLDNKLKELEIKEKEDE